MLPVIFSIGAINFYSLGLFLAIGFLLSAFFIWRRLKELGIDEEKVIDLIILAALVGLVLGRAFFIIQNISLLGIDPARWMLISRYPGLSFWGATGGIFLAIYWFSRRQNLDFWQLADEFVCGIMPFLVLSQLGALFDGTGFGKPTTMPWGIYATGSLLKRQPLPLVMAIVFFVLWIFFLRIERHWRAWEWYKSKAHGLMALGFGFFTMLTNFIVAIWRDNLLYWYWLEISFSLILAGLLLSIIYLRSARRLLGKTREKKNKSG